MPRDIVSLRGPVQQVHRAEDSHHSTRSGKTSDAPEATADGQQSQGRSPEDQHTHPPGSVDDYRVDHSSVVYMSGPDGTTIVYTGGATPRDYAADLSRLLRP